jgi:hypothetical protein
MWVRFTTDYDFSPDAKGGRVTIAYEAGMVMNVTRECADRAIAAGKAEPAKRKAEADGDE